MGVAYSNSPLHKFICDLEIASPKTHGTKKSG